MLTYVLVKDKNFGVMCFYLMSHLVLDIFNGGIFALYPFYDNVFYTRIDIFFNQGNFRPIIDYGISNKIENMGKGEGLVSSENFAIVILFTIILMSLAIKVMRNDRRIFK